MSSAADTKYRELETRLIELREKNQLTEKEDDDLLERLAELWWGLTPFERDCANTRAKAYADKSLKLSKE
jgi:hypothetical protein